MNKPIYSLTGILILAFGLFSSCGSNKMKSDEQLLSKQILTEEQQLAQETELRAEREKQLADSVAKLPKGFRFKEVRSVDPDYPPKVIDIAGCIGKYEDISLSDVASKIKYIRMDAVPDSTLPRNLKYKYYMMDNYIVAANLYGIHLFTTEGKFIRTIIKNDLNGVSYDEKNNRLLFRYDHTKVGAGTTVWAKGNNLFYEYSDNITGQKYIVMCDCSMNQTLSDSGFDPENQNKITGLGEVVFDLNHGTPVVKSIKNSNGMWSTTPESYYQEINVFSPDRNLYIRNFHDGPNMMGIFNSRGDTLSTFTKYERVENYTKSLARGTDFGTQYEINGNLFVRMDFNDTLFQVIPPNRLLPKYVLNLGKYKANKLEGMDPDKSLEGKIIPMEWAETPGYIFLTFSKDSYDCPRNRKDKSVKIYHAVYSKTSNQLRIINADPTNYDAPILENDIDGGLPVWPLSYMVDKNGKIMVSVKGKELKSHISTLLFKNSPAPANKKKELMDFANSVNNQDDVLLIVE